MVFEKDQFLVIFVSFVHLWPGASLIKGCIFVINSSYSLYFTLDLRSSYHEICLMKLAPDVTAVKQVICKQLSLCSVIIEFFCLLLIEFQ